MQHGQRTKRGTEHELNTQQSTRGNDRHIDTETRTPPSQQRPYKEHKPSHGARTKHGHNTKQTRTQRQQRRACASFRALSGHGTRAQPLCALALFFCGLMVARIWGGPGEQTQTARQEHLAAVAAAAAAAELQAGAAAATFAHSGMGRDCTQTVQDVWGQLSVLAMGRTGLRAWSDGIMGNKPWLQQQERQQWHQQAQQTRHHPLKQQGVRSVMSCRTWGCYGNKHRRKQQQCPQHQHHNRNI